MKALNNAASNVRGPHNVVDTTTCTGEEHAPLRSRSPSPSQRTPRRSSPRDAHPACSTSPSRTRQCPKLAQCRGGSPVVTQTQHTSELRQQAQQKHNWGGEREGGGGGVKRSNLNRRRHHKRAWPPHPRSDHATTANDVHLGRPRCACCLESLATSAACPPVLCGCAQAGQTEGRRRHTRGVSWWVQS